MAIDPGVLDDAFTALSSVKEKLSEAVVTLHEDGYHNYAGEVGIIRLAIERQEDRLAALHTVMTDKKGAKQ
jgi:hypothetical protein